MNPTELLALEQELNFPNFTNEDAYQVAQLILQQWQGEKLPNIRLRVVLDDALVFQYLMDGQSDDTWLTRKQRTIEKTGHSSLYVRTMHETENKYADLAEDENYGVAGGGFPLFIEGVLRGCVIVSGLPHTEDHRLVVTALKKYLTR